MLSQDQKRDEMEQANLPNATTTDNMTVVQNVIDPYRMTTSLLKSTDSKAEYTEIHMIITREDPITTIHVITVQLSEFRNVSIVESPILAVVKHTNVCSGRQRCSQLQLQQLRW